MNETFVDFDSQFLTAVPNLNRHEDVSRLPFDPMNLTKRNKYSVKAKLKEPLMCDTFYTKKKEIEDMYLGRTNQTFLSQTVREKLEKYCY
jgi:hypothetical protein